MAQLLPDFRDASLPEAAVRAALELKPHPEGGHYRELWRDAPQSGERGAASTILFLLAAGEHSHWHRIDASEIWLWQAGAPLLLGLCYADGTRKTMRLGPNAGNGESFQGVVPPHVWQEASSAPAPGRSPAALSRRPFSSKVSSLHRQAGPLLGTVFENLVVVSGSHAFHRPERAKLHFLLRAITL